MRCVYSALAVMLITASILSLAQSTYTIPTTTLTAQTANNTSAANSFTTQSNGNQGAGNVSKVDVHTLLYSGATTRLYAHLLLWFGQSNHMNVGYSSTDPAQIQNQINDMISRGINGVIIDWHGPNNSIDQATQLVMAQAELHPGFTFAIMVDQGAIEWDSCSGCTPQQALISQLQYVENTYFSSPAYMTIQGQPVVTNFNVDLSYSIDWNAVNDALSTHPLFLFQNNNGFTATLSGGSYSWVMPTTTDYGMSYLSSFYDTGMSFPSEQTVGAAYKGFNDTLASWGSDRIMGQQCGQTWLQTFSEINSLYDAGKQLPDLQLVTWNDYEEGTEIETGISNCLTLSASVAGKTLQWAVAGNEDTVEQYVVYISTDGQNLMALANVAPGVHSLNLCSFPISTGSYQLFVQAVGQPSITNQITSAIYYAPYCAGGTPPPTVSLSALPSSATVVAGQSVSFTVNAKTQSGSFNEPIQLSCSGLVGGLSCSFSPAVVTPGSGVATSTLTISASPIAKMYLPGRSRSWPIYGALLLPLGLLSRGVGRRSHQRRVRLFLLFAVVAVGMATVSCGGTSRSNAVSTPVSTSYSVTIQGNSGSSNLSTVVTVIVQ